MIWNDQVPYSTCRTKQVDYCTIKFDQGCGVKSQSTCLVVLYATSTNTHTPGKSTRSSPPTFDRLDTAPAALFGSLSRSRLCTILAESEKVTTPSRTPDGLIGSCRTTSERNVCSRAQSPPGSDVVSTANTRSTCAREHAASQSKCGVKCTQTLSDPRD